MEEKASLVFEDLEGALREVKANAETSEDIVDLSMMAESASGRAFLKVAKKVLAKLAQKAYCKPSINDGDVKRDIRYQLGGLGWCSLLLSLPDAARTLIQTQPESIARLESVERPKMTEDS